jgi:pimeloyl-ACP methyl ester carboxylesterase
MKNLIILFIPILLIVSFSCSPLNDKSKLELEDLEWDTKSPASMIELTIPSDSAMLQGLMYKANGSELHPTLFLLHGYPGNERNLDLAQVARTKGWNVVYFNYRGSWGSSGKYSIKNCVADVINAVNWATQQENLQIDPDRVVLFGHSLGAFVCLKAVQQLPKVKKAFALSTFDIYGGFKDLSNKEEITDFLKSWGANNYFVLNTPADEIFAPVLEDPSYYDLSNDRESLKMKKLMMLDEHPNNEYIANALAKDNGNFIKYEVWDTDHSFTNKRVSLINEVLTFIQE